MVNRSGDCCDRKPPRLPGAVPATLLGFLGGELRRHNRGNGQLSDGWGKLTHLHLTVKIALEFPAFEVLVLKALAALAQGRNWV